MRCRCLLVPSKSSFADLFDADGLMDADVLDDANDLFDGHGDIDIDID